MRRKFVAGNWKMNTLRQSAVDLAATLARELAAGPVDVQVAVCPPFAYLVPVGDALRGCAIELGAQNACCEKPGAFTGETGIDMLKDVGCAWVILGHSERRAIFAESDDLISKKVKAALAGGLQVILCVGETLAQRQHGQTEKVLETQLAGSLAGVSADELAQIVVAYEPVWAIGTGVVATTEQAESAHAHLRSWLANRYNPSQAEAMRILYGGSVKPDNALALLSQPDIDGALVGGASLKAADFLAIVRAAQTAAK